MSYSHLWVEISSHTVAPHTTPACGQSIWVVPALKKFDGKKNVGPPPPKAAENGDAAIRHGHEAGGAFSRRWRWPLRCEARLI